MPFYILSAIIATLLLTFFIFKRRHLYWISWKLPGPIAWLPIIGNGFSLMCDSKDLLKRILKLTNRYESPLRLWIGPRLMIFIKDPEQLQTVMQSSKFTQKSFVYRFLEPFMGNGLFTSTGAKHRDHRKLLQPLFGPKVLEGYSVLFQKHAEKLVKQLEMKYSERGPFDVLNILHESAFEATMDILIEDQNTAESSNDYKLIPEYIRRFYQIFTKRVTTFWLYSDRLFRLTNLYKEQEDMSKIASEFTEKITKQHVEKIIERLNGPKNDEEERSIPSVLEMIIQLVKDNPECLTPEECKDHMMTFGATSQDTQSSAIAFTLIMLGIHKSAQDKMLNEIQEVLDGKSKIQYDDVGKLKYMEMCLKESMRLFPLGPFLPRDVTESFKLGDLLIPKGCSIILGVYNVHRDPKYWKNPNEFYPEHFTDEATSKRHPYAFLPFSGGPRRCIAQQFSYVNMKIILTNILLNFVIDCPYSFNDMKLMTDVSIRPINGYNIQISRRII